MANHNNAIPSWLNEAYMEKILREPLKVKNLKVLNMDIKAGSNVGDNYVCQLWRIKLNAIMDEKNKELSVMAKLLVPTAISETIKDDVDVFEIEAKVLDSILPMFNEGDIGPVCYHVDFKEKTIFMEDLQTYGYSMQKMFLNKQQCGYAVEALATFHGETFNLIVQDRLNIDHYKAVMFDGTYNDVNRAFTTYGQKSLNKNIEKYELPAKYTKKLLNFMKDMESGGLMVAKPSDTDIPVLLHGDCHLKNMMFRFNKDGTPNGIKLIDFQVVNKNSFAVDLHYFLWSSATSDVLVEELDNLLERYYLKLKEIAPDIPRLSLDMVKSEFYKRIFLGYMISVLFRPFILAEIPPDVEKIFSGEEVDKGYDHPTYISDLQKLLPLLEARGALD